jgi:hypothetical protein
MRNLKRTRFFSLGRKWVFTLALFLLVFAAASVVKVQAVGNVTGWFWGGGAEQLPDVNPNTWDGTNTNVRWISMNSDNSGIGHAIPYGVNVPTTDGNVTGYAWSGGDDSGPGLGWIDFNPNGDDGIRNTSDDHCTTGAPASNQYKAATCDTQNGENPGVIREGDFLKGWARIVGIAQESANGNSGGWLGWLHMDGNYGIDLLKMNGDQTTRIPSDIAAKMTFVALGSDELGWADASRAKAPCTPLPGGCGSAMGKTYCSGSPAPAASDLCNSDSVLKGLAPGGSAPWSWQCESNVCPGPLASCSKDYTLPDVGKCGTDDGVNFCGKSALPGNLCDSGTASSVITGYSEYTWTCGSTTCGGKQVSCSAPGNHCGWIETNP